MRKDMEGKIETYLGKSRVHFTAPFMTKKSSKELKVGFILSSGSFWLVRVHFYSWEMEL